LRTADRVFGGGFTKRFQDWGHRKSVVGATATPAGSLRLTHDRHDPEGRAQFIWEHKAMYFGADPAALDKTGWKVIGRKRAGMGLLPVTESKANEFNRFSFLQVEHIELAGIPGLREFDHS
jgi:hypothetical protein